MQRDYELVVVLNPALSQEESAATWERIKTQIGERGGELVHEEGWGTRRLAYPIRKAGVTFLEGDYRLVRFDMDAHAVKETETSLRVLEQVLRFLLVKSEAPRPVPAEPAVAEAAVAEAALAEPVATESIAAAPIEAEALEAQPAEAILATEGETKKE